MLVIPGQFNEILDYFVLHLLRHYVKQNVSCRTRNCCHYLSGTFVTPRFSIRQDCTIFSQLFYVLLSVPSVPNHSKPGKQCFVVPASLLQEELDMNVYGLTCLEKHSVQEMKIPRSLVELQGVINVAFHGYVLPFSGIKWMLSFCLNATGRFRIMLF